MKQILNKYCSESPNVGINESGLFLLDLPTGMGKTHHVLDYIFDNYSKKRKIFFVTNLKKNLPIEDLKERFIKSNKLNDFNKSVLFIDANYEAVIRNLPAIEETIPKEIKAYPEYKGLWDGVRFLSECDAKLSKGKRLESIIISTQSKIKDDVRTILEPRFRNRINVKLQDEFKKLNLKSETKRLKYISENYSWLINLYPAIESIEKNIFFLSIDKFFLKNTTFLRPSYYFLSDKITKDALIFIDEFDATKRNILNTIIQNGLNKRIDLIDLFTSIRKQLKQHKLPEKLLIESKQQQQLIDEKGFVAIRALSEKIENISDKIHQDFNLEYFLKTENADKRRNFIFQDYRYHYILKEGIKGIEYRPEESARINWLRFTPHYNSKNKKSLPLLLQEIKGFITFFKKGVKIIAENYKQSKDEESGLRDEFPIESALQTVLDSFGLNGQQRNYIVDAILQNDSSPKSKHKIVDLSFFENGFRYYDFKDSDTHDTRSIIHLFDCENTPEKFIVQLAQRAKVIGISATATIPTDVGNYSLEYLQSRLGADFHTLITEEKSQLRAQFLLSTDGYKNINIRTSFIESSISENLWLTVFEDAEIVKEIKTSLQSLGCTDYMYSRYLRLAQVIKYFITHDELYSLLCFTNAIPKGESGFCKKGLNIIFDYILDLTEKQELATSNGKSGLEELYYIVDSENFDSKKQEIHSKLEAGQKLLVITTYATMGAGQNIQYKAPKKLMPTLIKINDYPNKQNLKDFDGLYLEKPTNLLVNKRGDLTEKLLIEYIFQLEYLASKGQISNDQLKSEIKKCFNKLADPTFKTIDKYDIGDNTLYRKQDYYDNICSVIIQAIGRITRSNLKSDTLHLLADLSLQEPIARFNTDDYLTIREFTLLKKECEQASLNLSSSFEQEHINNLCLKAENITSRSTAYINMLLRNLRKNDNYITQWKLLREQVLKMPTTDDLPDYRLRDYYIELPEKASSYQYETKNDFEVTKVTFSSMSPNVSQAQSGLTKYFQLMPELEQYFIEKNYAVSFRPSKYILSPAMFKNIYCGAIGEIVGKYIFELFSIHLEEISDEYYELFDYRLKSDVVVDFKNWNTILAQDENKKLAEIFEKMETCKAKTAFIINIYSEGFEVSRHENEEKDKLIVIVPSLFKNGVFDNNILQRLIKFAQLNDSLQPA
jgi:hypothetical protein